MGRDHFTVEILQNVQQTPLIGDTVILVYKRSIQEMKSLYERGWVEAQHSSKKASANNLTVPQQETARILGISHSTGHKEIHEIQRSLCA